MPRWEETLQENVLFSLHFFHWLRSRYKFSPDFDSCNLLLDKLVEANAYKAARNFLHQIGLDPEPPSLERYLRCLCANKSVEDAVDVFSILNKIGYYPSIATWNLALLACLKVVRNDIFWKLYQDMIESGLGVNIDVGTLGCLIQAFCIDGKASKGFELLQNYGRVSQLLHTMIATGRAPDIYTYQEVINGLCKNRVSGREARKLWFEINIGMLPNEYTYNAMLYGLYKVHDLEEANRLYKEMLENGYGETTVSYIIMIAGESRRESAPIIEVLRRDGHIEETKNLLKDMQSRSVELKVCTHDHFIAGLCEQGYVAEGLEWFGEMLKNQLKPQQKTLEKLVRCLSQRDRTITRIRA
ncbi:Tetratricopeptide repeat-like superfamily protein [Hibiscus syriacus]|uniref:Tetratricopeptide repeat-like superfamily protein n=1 Tax=Hibiscus syriacus TaxID=106335 RepID=A0A6A3ANU7_HIBSY|nr:Tetratricopeptide repeat-like superfamily protein [Hibiscus syriacus]